MSQLTDKKENSEIERIVDLDRMGNNGSAVDIVASDGERAALAKRFGFLGLPAFSARVTIEILQADKRPVAAAADHFEIRRVTRVETAMDRATSLVLLHDPGHSLDERILREQFGY